MREYPAPPSARMPTHPGELMAEILHEHLRLSTARAAAAMRVTRQALHRVLSTAGACSPEIALRFCALAGGSPGLFLRMQENFDLWKAKKKLARVLPRISAARRAA